MTWDSDFFVPKNNIFRTPEESAWTSFGENKFAHCSGCLQSIGIVSTMLYEINEKLFCSECYFRKIISQALERDHYDLKKEKEEPKASP